MKMRAIYAAFALPMLSYAWTVQAAPEEKPDAPVPEARQSRLLERFGKEGIDEDGDGTLTRAEVRAFFADRPGQRPGRGQGADGGRGRRDGAAERGCRGKGPHGREGRGKGRRIGRLLKRLDRLDGNGSDPAIHAGRFRGPAELGEGGERSAEAASDRTERQRHRLLKRLLKLAPQADADEDGVISDSELADFRAEHETRVRAHLLIDHPEADADGDGALSDEEVEVLRDQRRAERRMKLLERHPDADLDGDGSLSDDEVRAFRAEHPRRRGGKHGRQRGDHGGRGGRGGTLPERE